MKESKAEISLGPDSSMDSPKFSHMGKTNSTLLNHIRNEVLAQVIMIAKSLDLPFASWRPREASDIISVWVQRPENQICIVWTPIQGQEKVNVPSLAYRQETKGATTSFLFLFVFFRSSPDWVILSQLDRAIYFTDSTDSTVIAICEYSHRNTQRQYLIWTPQPCQVDT